MAKALDRATLRVIAERALDEWDICAVELELISISENTVFRVDTRQQRNLCPSYPPTPAIIRSRN